MSENNEKVSVELTKTEVAAIFSAVDYVNGEYDGVRVQVGGDIRQGIYNTLDEVGLPRLLSLNETIAERFAGIFDNGNESDSIESRTFDEIITMLSDYVGEIGKSESAVETLGRLLGELEGYRRNVLAADIQHYLRFERTADSLSFAIWMSPKYNNVPGAVIQRIMDEITKEDDNNR